MKQLLELLRIEWRHANELARIEAERNGDFALAAKYEDCTALNDVEDIKGVCDMLFTPQGSEYVVDTKLPSMFLFRKFKKFGTERYGVYIDSNKAFAFPLNLVAPKRACFIGDTTATVTLTFPGSIHIMALRGAKVRVIAKAWSIGVIIKDDESTVETEVYDHAKILGLKK